ncbi:MAG: 16S rRNA (adenine(1518)-N(6)/adenine(1519)-N(6))-dimethyltransferase RsmA, partial [Candidatus Acidiferrales bacterium]
MAHQKLGQHFLGDPAWQKRILETLPRGPDDVWLEIGTGHGEMTRLLAGRGRRVISIEADLRLAENLRRRIESQATEWPCVEIVSGDVLQLDLAKIGGGGRFRVYGNLPYYITSPILHHLFGYADQIASIHIVIQFEVAARIAARPGRREYGYLSAACQFYARPEIVLQVPPSAFRPPPRVRSALVRMTLP